MISVKRFLFGAGAGVALGALALFSEPPQPAEAAHCPHMGCDGPETCRFMGDMKCEVNPPPCVTRPCELMRMRQQTGDN